MKDNRLSNPRALAMDSLLALERDGRYSNLEVDARLKNASLSPADRALYTRLVYGVTERRLTLDWIIDRYSTRPVEELDADVRCALRMGIYQLVWMDRVPAHAAVDQSVRLVPRGKSGVVNAILRAFLRAGKRCAFPDPADPIRYASIRYSVPEPLVEIFSDALGEAADELEDLLEAMNREPQIGLRVNPRKIDPEEAAFLLAGEVSPLAPDVVLVDSLTDEARDGITRGLWFVEDPASRLVAAAVGAKGDDTVVDTCACPGGKAFSIALDLGNRGRVCAFDLHENKLSLVKRGAERLGIGNLTVERRDARDPDPALIGRADRVLCDAPCSGLGVIAKKPDIRYRDPDAIARLPAVQLQILEGASRYVREGGVLVYSTCTLNRAENQDVTARFLEAHPDFALTVDPRLPDGERVFWPHRDGCDGFYAAKMIRRRAD